ncbi:Gfo/Idh/MocA family protein [Roseisalinus antarcticus]|uniref:Putative oxidoreductase YteT n=1 Tax=Roseisalinus antarcticus TaxID=254357 RepID=A0A1Y5SWI6_9RHOB|nr:Gfo/Idh/MocA family oxidoreductase [Roseisalinus antarcticus]SLN50128.1 Putative oxidoreductase YteT precursor [Roseisalinus antarcticus]
MKIATAGIGLRPGHVLSTLLRTMPEARMVGYYDPQPTFLDMIGEDTPRFASVEEMLAETRPDLFFVGSPNVFHLDQIEAGLEAGVPRIFTEKPVVVTMEETMRLAKLLASHGPERVMVGLVLRYSQHMVDLRTALAEGVLGRIASLEANEHIGPYHGAFFMRDWRRKTDLSGGFMLEKCCHDLDLYNMITGSRPRRVASFGGRRSFVPDFAPTSNAEAEIFHVKKSVWESTDDPFRSDGDIIDCQTAILSYESGSSMTFHTNLMVPDEQRRFCVIGAQGMAEGDFVRGYLKITRRDGERYADHDYTTGARAAQGNHYGADQMMCDDLAAFLRGQTEALPVSIVDALEAGVAALALDQARQTGVVDLTDTWAEFDSYGLRAGGTA